MRYFLFLLVIVTCVDSKPSDVAKASNIRPVFPELKYGVGEYFNCI